MLCLREGLKYGGFLNYHMFLYNSYELQGDFQQLSPRRKNMPSEANSRELENCRPYDDFKKVKDWILWKITVCGAKVRGKYEMLKPRQVGNVPPA